MLSIHMYLVDLLIIFTTSGSSLVKQSCILNSPREGQGQCYLHVQWVDWLVLPLTIHQSFQSTGFLYPCFPSGRVKQRTKGVWYPASPATQPIMAVNKIFSNRNHVHVSSSVVIVNGGKERYLIIGYFDDTFNINHNLSTICPLSPWKGELIIFSLGKYVRVLSRPSGSKFTVKKAIKRWAPIYTYSQPHFWY